MKKILTVRLQSYKEALIARLLQHTADAVYAGE